MLDALRQGAGTWVAKIFIGVLALSFAVWGISDVFTGGHAGALATVGEEKVFEQQYQSAFQRRLSALSRQFGRQLSTQQARQLGLDRQVLSELVGQAALDNEIKTLKLALRDEAIAGDIVKNPVFHDNEGKFSRVRFEQLLRSNGFSEATYVALERRNRLRAQLSAVVETDVAVPNILLKAFHKQLNETRKAKYFIIPRSVAGVAPEPSDSDLEKFYQSNKSRFTAPQYRAATILALEPKDLAENTVTVNDTELRAAYQEREAEFTTPEKRTIERIPYGSAEEAEAARKKLETGADFNTLASDKKLKPIDTILGEFTRKDIPDAKLAEAAFALPLNEVSQPVTSALSTVLIRVTKITPEVKKTFEDVKDQLKKEIALERAQEQVLNLHDTIEDERAGGATLQEIAGKLNLKALVIDAIDASGKDAAGNPVPNLPDEGSFLAALFQSDVGVENDPADTRNEGFVWFDVTKITPQTTRLLKDVRPRAVELWKQEKQTEKLVAKAREVVTAITNGASVEAQATTLEQTATTTKAMKRTETDGKFGAQAVASLFQTPLNAASQSVAQDGGMIIYQVVDVTVPPFIAASKEAAAIKQRLTQRMGNDFTQQYVTGLQNKAGVDINQTIWRRLQGITQ